MNAAQPVVRLLKLNNLQYNANRDPQAYRRVAGEPFRIEALIPGRGSAVCRVEAADGACLVEQTLRAPVTFVHELVFDTPGTRIVRLSIVTEQGTFARDLRLDVLEHAWVG
jgi:hypothetical protein